MPDGLEKSELEKKREAKAAAEIAAEEAPADSEEETEQGDPDPTELLSKECDDLRDQLLRARADFDNYRKRVARDADRTRKLAAESLIRDLLPIVDSIELALNHKDSNPDALAEGVEMVAKLFQETLTRNGLEPIAAEGEVFDPELHDAMMRQPDDSVAPDTIVQEYQKGYRIGDVVLRHAKVVVSAPPETDSKANEDADSGAAASEAAPAEE
jgi:molecular chaperone GrpE